VGAESGLEVDGGASALRRRWRGLRGSSGSSSVGIIAIAFVARLLSRLSSPCRFVTDAYRLCRSP
jgi:hypothetical protein